MKNIYSALGIGIIFLSAVQAQQQRMINTKEFTDFIRTVIQDDESIAVCFSTPQAQERASRYFLKKIASEVKDLEETISEASESELRQHLFELKHTKSKAVEAAMKKAIDASGIKKISRSLYRRLLHNRQKIWSWYDALYNTQFLDFVRGVLCERINHQLTIWLQTLEINSKETDDFIQQVAGQFVLALEDCDPDSSYAKIAEIFGAVVTQAEKNEHSTSCISESIHECSTHLTEQASLIINAIFSDEE